MLVNIGKGIELVVPSADGLTPEVRDHIMYIGWRNILMDSHAGITTVKADGGDVQAMSRAVAEKKLAALINGELRTTSFREGDPVRAEALRLATAAIDAALKRAGKKPSSVDAKVKRAKAQEIIGKFMDKAKANVAERQSADVDIDDLGL